AIVPDGPSSRGRLLLARRCSSPAHRGTMTRRRFDTRLSPARDQQSGSRPARRTDLPSGRDGRPTPLDAPVCLAIFWLSLSFVVGQLFTLCTARVTRKGMISNDEDQ